MTRRFLTAISVVFVTSVSYVCAQGLPAATQVPVDFEAVLIETELNQKPVPRLEIRLTNLQDNSSTKVITG